MSFLNLNIVDMILITTLVSFFYFLKLWWQRRHIRKLASEIPGPKSYPLIGNILDVLAWTKEESYKKYLRMVINYSPTVRFWAGPYLIIFVSDPCDLEILMNSDKCLERERFKNISDTYPLGDGLLVIGGEQWRIHRKFIISSFHYRHFEYFVKVFNKKSNILVNCLKQDPNTTTCINILHYFTRAAFDTICETIIGVEMNSQDKGSDKFIDSMTTYLRIGTQMFSQPWLLNPTIVRLTSYHKVMTENAAYMTSFCNELINNKMKEYRERTKDSSPTKEHMNNFNKRDQPLLIDSIIEMIENNECFFSKKEIIGEINNIIMAGMDSTANSLSLTMMILGFHQDVQRKVQEELDAVFGDDVERSVSMEDINNLKYIEQVIKESLRLYPAAPFVPRNTIEDIKITNYTIPKGCDVIFNIYSLHRNPKIYPNPDEFDPENFSPERSKGRHPYSFLPFSGGFRKCVGYKFAMIQMKIVLATVLRHFTVHPACDRKEMDRWDFNFTLKLVNGSKVKLISRNMVKGNK